MKDQISLQRVSNLHPKAREIFKAFVEEIEKVHNTTFRVAQGLRTFAEQQAIYDQPHDGKDNDGDGKVDEADEKVSNAIAGKSYHNYGLAIDIVELKNGKINWNFQYSKLAPIAQKYGLTWGGNWNDNPHYEIKFGYKIADLLKKYNAKDFIAGTQYVNL